MIDIKVPPTDTRAGELVTRMIMLRHAGLTVCMTVFEFQYAYDIVIIASINTQTKLALELASK